MYIYLLSRKIAPKQLYYMHYEKLNKPTLLTFLTFAKTTIKEQSLYVGRWQCKSKRLKFCPPGVDQR